MRPTKLSIALHSFSLVTLVEAILASPRSGPQRSEDRRSGAAERLEACGHRSPTAASERAEVRLPPTARGQLAAARDSIVTAADDLILIASPRNLPEQSRHAGRSAHRVAIENWPVT